MTSTLGTFIETFLQMQGLRECTITFEPHHAKVARRAKRSDTRLANASDPLDAVKLGNTKTVGDLMNKLLSLSDQTRAWTVEGNKRYKPWLWDDAGTPVKPETPLGELRGRADTRQQEMLQRVERILATALHDCDRLADRAQVNRLLKTLLVGRRKGAA